MRIYMNPPKDHRDHDPELAVGAKIEEFDSDAELEVYLAQSSSKACAAHPSPRRRRCRLCPVSTPRRPS
jgi:hypothetical protein